MSYSKLCIQPRSLFGNVHLQFPKPVFQCLHLSCFTILSLTETAEDTQFLYLTCDLPAPPLYPDDLRENIIPQVPLANILAKFNGITEKEYKTYKDSTMKRFKIFKLPPYIILYVKVNILIQEFYRQ